MFRVFFGADLLAGYLHEVIDVWHIALSSFLFVGFVFGYPALLELKTWKVA